MDFGSLACDFDFRRMVGFPSNEIHVILDPPERNKRLYRQHRQEKEHLIERMRRAATARAARRVCAAERPGPGLLCGIGTKLLPPWKSFASIFTKEKLSRAGK
ncbi:hypothetical protein Pcac1_g241 [Phytophthora cactorum]|nr:hypothetical protein Pcac1_g241 [Phytophthora cactorum]